MGPLLRTSSSFPVKAQNKVRRGKIFMPVLPDYAVEFNHPRRTPLMADTKAATPAYVPFKTFTSVLDSFTSFLPDRIDTTMWQSYSGGIKSQLLGALKFLKLIEDDGTTTEELRALSRLTPEQRAVQFKQVLKESYGPLMSLDLTKATPGSFDAEMRKYGQEGDTHRKAASFFLQAAKWSGVPLSPLLLKKGSLSGSRRKRVTNGTGSVKAKMPPPGKSGQPIIPEVPSVSGPTKRILLSGGYELSLSAEVDLFKMNSVDRNFVLKLLDEMEAYELENEVEEDDSEGEES
jgi:hypothetical protein